jgi:hypothetical protein
MDQKQYRDLKDMIDGGGAGQMGDTFQGGGLLSILANAFAKPYGSEDPVRKRERMKAFGLLGDDIPKPVQVQPVMRTRQQVVPTYGADAGMVATNRAMNMPYNQTQAMPGYNTPAPNPVAEMPLRQPATGYTYGQPTVEEMRKALGRKFPNHDFSEFDLSAPSDDVFIKRLYEGHILGANGDQSPSMDRTMMIGVLARAGLDRSHLEELPTSALQGLYRNQMSRNPRAYGRGM